MRILHVYRTYFPDPPGGIQEAIRQICLATKTHGFENAVFTLSRAPKPMELERSEARIIRCRSWAAPASCDIGDWRAVEHFACAAKWADVVHYHYPWPFADVLEKIVGPHKPKIMTYHSDIVRQRFVKFLYTPLMHLMLNAMTSIVATSPIYAATSPLLTSPRYKNRVRVIPLGVDKASYISTPDQAILKKLGLESGAPYFLFLGALRYYKGLNFLLEAAKRVNAPIIIAGSGSAEASLRARAMELGLQNVIFAGQVSEAEKIALLQACQAFVLPSHLRSEAFGVVLIEAGMYAKPMVSYEVGSGTSYANINEETGFVVPPENPIELANAMNRLLDKDLAKKFGDVAEKRYQRLFSAGALGRAYADLYQEMSLKIHPR